MTPFSVILPLLSVSPRPERRIISPNVVLTIAVEETVMLSSASSVTFWFEEVINAVELIVILSVLDFSRTCPTDVVLPPATIAPSASIVVAPAIFDTDPLASVADPERSVVSTPLLVVVIPAVTTTFVPVRFTPATVFVLTAPVKVVVPLPACCRMLAAVTVLSAVTLVALMIVRMPRRVANPTASSKSILPVPAVRVRFWPPFSVL